MEIFQFEVYIQNDSLFMAFIDKMAELLRRLTVNQLRSPSVIRVPSLSFFFNWFYGERDSNLQFEFSNPSSNLGKKLVS